MVFVGFWKFYFIFFNLDKKVKKKLQLHHPESLKSALHIYYFVYSLFSFSIFSSSCFGTSLWYYFQGWLLFHSEHVLQMTKVFPYSWVLSYYLQPSAFISDTVVNTCAYIYFEAFDVRWQPRGCHQYHSKGRAHGECTVTATCQSCQ